MASARTPRWPLSAPRSQPGPPSPRGRGGQGVRSHVARRLTVRGFVGYDSSVAGDTSSLAHVPVAQWIERWFAEPKIGGSSPLGYTRTPRRVSRRGFFLSRSPHPSPTTRGEDGKPLSHGERGWGEGSSDALALQRLFDSLAQVSQRAEQVGVGRCGVERVERSAQLTGARGQPRHQLQVLRILDHLTHQIA
jgi:hypothetical protein